MANSSFDSEPLVNVDILKKKYVRLVQDVDANDILSVLEPFLLYTEIDSIKALADRGDKTRKLIDCLHRRTEAKSYGAFNAFMKILGGTQPELFTEIVGRHPTNIEADFCVKGLTSELKKVIKATGHSTDSPLDEQIDLDREHIQLQIIKMQNDTKRFERTDTEGLYPSVCTQSLPHQYQQRLFEIEKAEKSISACNILNAGGQTSKSVLLSGRAGVGKSTNLQWLARQWAQNDWAKGFTILFLIPLRMLSSSDSHITVIELLTLYGLFQLTAVSSQNLLCKWIKNSKCRVLFLVDGLDEILGFSNKVKHAPKITTLDHKAHAIDLCINILRGDLLPGCTVVCTSRPFAGLSYLNTETALEILGLTKKQVKRFVDVKHTEKAGQIMSVLQRNPILMSVCGITFYCMAVSTLLSEGVQMVDADLGTYTRLTSFILVKYVSRKLSNYPFVIEVNSYFHKLAFLAYKGIFMPNHNAITKINFNEFDIAKVRLSPKELDLIRKTGLLQIKDFTVGQRKSISSEFMHLTTQELLAVTYLLKRPVASKQMLENVFTAGQFNMALLYQFGLQYDKNCIWIKDVYEAVCLSDTCLENDDYHSHISELLKQLCASISSDELKICQLVYESQLEDQAKEVVEYVAPEGVLDIDNTPMTAIDMLAVTFVCRHSSALREISLVSTNADDTCMAILSSSLIKHHVSSLQSLNIADNNISAEGMEALVNSLQHCHHLINLNISSNDIGAGGMNILANALSSMKSLQMLDVSCSMTTLMRENNLDICMARTVALKRDVPFNHFGDEGTKTLVAALKLGTNESLTTVILSSNDIGPVGAATLAEALFTNTCLQELDVSENYFCDFGAKALGRALCINDSLISLEIGHNVIGFAGTAALAEGLKTNMCLQELQVSYNQIGDLGAKALAAVLCTNQNLTTLKLSSSDIGPDGAAALAEALHKNTCLDKLIVSRNKIGVEGAKALAAALTTNESLTTLDISHNGIGPEGAAALAEALHRNMCLQVLDVSGNKLRDEGIRSLAKTLCSNESLRTIKYIGIGIDGASALAEALRGNKGLKTLIVSRQELGDEGVKVLQEVCDHTGKHLLCSNF